jgi:hypothetical protein
MELKVVGIDISNSKFLAPKDKAGLTALGTEVSLYPHREAQSPTCFP